MSVNKIYSNKLVRYGKQVTVLFFEQSGCDFGNTVNTVFFFFCSFVNTRELRQIKYKIQQKQKILWGKKTFKQ